jgi:hypothetical protein
LYSFNMIMPGSVGLSAFRARHASQLMAVALSKRRNAAMDADRPSLWALLWCPATALQCLTRTKAIAYTLRLVAKHHKSAEPGIIMLKEYGERT